MGKKRIIQKADLTTEEGRASAVKLTSPKKKITDGVIHILSTYNNTVIAITDESGDVLMSASSGALGFSGAKKGTPYAATKVAEFLGEKAKVAGIKSMRIMVRGVGGGRDAALRSFIAQGFNVDAIRDITPMPHNGPKPPKPRRV